MLELIAHPGTAGTKRPWRLGPLNGFLLNVCMLLFVSTPALTQTASVRGTVVDQSGAVIPRATVTLSAPSGVATY